MTILQQGLHRISSRRQHLAKAMVTKFGMSEELGLVNYDSDSEEVFVGRDFGHASRGYGEEVAGKIDREVKTNIDECYEKAKTMIETI